VRVQIHSILAAALLALAAQSAMAQSKIGVVDSERIMREATPALRAQKKLEKEFEKRDQELQRIARELQTMQDDLERNGLTMGENERRNKERNLNDLNRDFQRKRREFTEDLNQRRNEEFASMLERINVAIKQMAEAEKYDLILQDAVYMSPRIDITDKVIKVLESAK